MGITCYMRFNKAGECLTDTRYDGVLISTEVTDPASTENFKAAAARESLCWKPEPMAVTRSLKLAEAPLTEVSETRLSPAQKLQRHFYERNRL